MRLLQRLRAVRGTVTDIVGRLSEEGVCAERVPPSREWTIRARLVEWCVPGCAPAPEPLEIVHRGTADDLAAMQRRWIPGREVHARVRLRGRNAELVRVPRGG